MKLFHSENGKKVVYVQMKDLLYLAQEIDLKIPAAVYTEVFEGLKIQNNTYLMNFIRFEKEEEIQFFEKLDFIIDYNEYKNFSDKQIKREREVIEKRIEEIEKEWNYNKEINEEKEYRNIVYKRNLLIEIYDEVYGRSIIPFPDFIKK